MNTLPCHLLPAAGLVRRPTPSLLHRLRLTIATLVALLAGGPVWAVDFAHDVVPILRVHCGTCHTGAARQGGFSLNTRETTLAGGDSGTPGFVAGKAAESELIARVTSTDPDYRMPSEGEPLPAEAIAVLKAWIDEQAVWTEGFSFQGEIYEPPLRLRDVTLPAARDGRTNPIDRIIDTYQQSLGIPSSPRCDDRTFIRRVNLDLVGLLPNPERVEAFVADSSPTKRQQLVRTLLDDKVAYADHWMTFWNDLLRNDYSGTGFITGGRRQITGWLYRALVDNMPYDQFVRGLVAPTDASRGFIDGIVWRGEVNASQTVPVQFAQNIGQTFLGINLKCASCHDSFVDRWKLQETYDLAAIAAPTELELYRCDKATGAKATPGWMFADLGQVDPAAAPEQRLAQLAALMTKPENGWLSRNLVNRLWQRLLGRGLVHPVDALRTRPWSEDLLDWLAGDLVAHGWDTKHVLEMICTSEAYGAITPPLDTPAVGSAYAFAGPLSRRMTAEQFTDALWQLSGAAPAKPDAEVVRFDMPPAADSQPPSNWIWTNTTGGAEPGEKRTFRVKLALSAEPLHAVAVFSADNRAVMFVNGKRIDACEDWAKPLSPQITVPLKAGENTILVVVTNGEAGGPAALRADIRARLADGSEAGLSTDSTWEWTVQRPTDNGDFPDGKDPGDWQPAVVIADQAVWKGADAAFSEGLRAAAPGPLPMVRAGLVKGTSLMAALGRPNRDQVVTSRPSDLTTLEAILLANEQTLSDWFSSGGERILAAHGPRSDDLLQWLYAAALSRRPTAAEAAAASEILTPTPTAQTVADCLWAVCMLPEFQLVR
jgi:hypothetical protein